MIVQGLLNDIATWNADLQYYEEEEGQLSILKSALESNLKETGYDIYTLIQLQEMQSTLINHKTALIGSIDATITSVEGNPSLIEEEQSALLNALGPLYQDQNDLMEMILCFQLREL